MKTEKKLPKLKQYTWNWMNQRGEQSGYNSNWARTKRESLRLAKLDEHDDWYKLKEDGSVEYHVNAMLVDPKSHRRVNSKEMAKIDYAGYLMTI